MEPIKEREFIAQLAQFSTLEGVNNLSRDLGTIADLERGFALAKCRSSSCKYARLPSYIGYRGRRSDRDSKRGGSLAWGGRPQIVVEGQAYDLGYIQELKVVTTETNVEDE